MPVAPFAYSVRHSNASSFVTDTVAVVLVGWRRDLIFVDISACTLVILAHKKRPRSMI